MTVDTTHYDHIGMAFEPPAIYAPPRFHRSQIVYLHTVRPLPEGARLDYLLNGESGPVDGLSLLVTPEVVSVYCAALFKEMYRGPWPALMEVRYLKNDLPADLVRLPILDPETAAATSMRVHVVGSPAAVPPQGSEAYVQITPRLFDSNLVPLPFMYGTDIQLLDTPEGIVLDDNILRVTDQAVPGDYRVQVSTRWGLEQTLTIQVNSAR